MSAILKQEVITTFDNLIALLSGISQQQIDQARPEGSWTIGQVAEHITLADSGFHDFFGSDTEPTQRAPDEKVAALGALFLDRDIKMESPDFIQPTATEHPKDGLINGLEQIKKEVSGIIDTMDLSLTCKQMDLPQFGYLTRLEWIHFAVFHTKRHTAQIQEIIDTQISS